MRRPTTKANGHTAIKPAIVPEADRTAIFTGAVSAKLDDLVKAMLPSRASPTEQAAAEYWASSVTNALIEMRRAKAKKIATALHVLPDYVATPFPVGTAETIYADPLVTIGMKVVEQADRIDTLALVADLESAGVASKLLKRLVKKHTRAFAGAHIFTAVLNAAT